MDCLCVFSPHVLPHVWNIKYCSCEFSCVSMFFAPSFLAQQCRDRMPDLDKKFFAFFPPFCTVFLFSIFPVFPMDPLTAKFTTLARKDLFLLEYVVKFSQLAIFTVFQRRLTTLRWTPCYGSGQITIAPLTSQTPLDWVREKQSSGVWRVSTSDPEHSQTQSPAHHLPTVRGKLPEFSPERAPVPPIHPAQRGLLFLSLAQRELLFPRPAQRGLLFPRPTQRGLLFPLPAQRKTVFRVQPCRSLASRAYRAGSQRCIQLKKNLLKKMVCSFISRSQLQYLRWNS